ncbi:hypothetical protein FQA39_LY06736 [Lamprigera yunnana]|nr:hypothetical protein FQA39_LY06736 [Lamprigera yunnana]
MAERVNPFCVFCSKRSRTLKTFLGVILKKSQDSLVTRKEYNLKNIQEVEDDQIETENNEDISKEQEIVDTSDDSWEESEFESDASEVSDNEL